MIEICLKTALIAGLPLLVLNILDIGLWLFLVAMVLHVLYFALYRGYFKGEYWVQPYAWIMGI